LVSIIDWFRGLNDDGVAAGAAFALGHTLFAEDRPHALNALAQAAVFAGLGVGFLEVAAMPHVLKVH
jgi:hypothetical protein